MKTQVLQLDPHDDIISTRDKLGWKQTGRILLVWPRKGHVLTRRLDLVLLARHTASLGAQLALITRDPQVRDNLTVWILPSDHVGTGRATGGATSTGTPNLYQS
jgi:hypothetical protein